MLIRLFRFLRLLPMDAAFVATSVIPVSTEATGYGPNDYGTARLHNLRIDSRKKNRNRFFRREAVVLRNMNTGATTVVRVLGVGPQITGLSLEGIALDYATRDELGLKSISEVRIEVRRATSLDMFAFLWNDHDPFRRFVMRWGLTGTLLGLTGLSSCSDYVTALFQ